MPEQPTSADMAHDLNGFSRECGEWIAAKRALYAEQAARELLAALHRCAGWIGHDAIEARVLMARYESIYGEQPK